MVLTRGWDGTGLPGDAVIGEGADDRLHGVAIGQQRSVTVMYNGISVGEYSVDLLVEKAVIVDLKIVQQLGSVHRAQCLNYLRATGMHLCLLMNFGTPRLEARRIVHGL